MGQVLGQASLAALASMFVGLVPMGTAVVYAIWPSEQRLALLRPLSLATIFAAVAGVTLGLLNVLRGWALAAPPWEARIVAIGLAESLVPLLCGFAFLTISWLCVAFGMWRRP